MKKLIGVGLALLSLSCTPNTKIEEDFNKEGLQLQVKVTSYPSLKNLQDNTSRPILGLKGQATYYLNDSNNECHIKIYKPSPVKVDDEYALTLGHELMHCLYGQYH